MVGFRKLRYGFLAPTIQMDFTHEFISTRSKLDLTQKSQICNVTLFAYFFIGKEELTT